MKFCCPEIDFSPTEIARAPAAMTNNLTEMSSHTPEIDCVGQEMTSVSREIDYVSQEMSCVNAEIDQDYTAMTNNLAEMSLHTPEIDTYCPEIDL